MIKTDPLEDLYAEIRHKWVRSRLFQDASDYLYLEAIRPSNSDRHLALKAHEHRIENFECSSSRDSQTRQFMLVYTLIRHPAYKDGIDNSVRKFAAMDMQSRKRQY